MKKNQRNIKLKKNLMMNFEALKKIGANQFQTSTVDNRKQ